MPPTVPSVTLHFDAQAAWVSEGTLLSSYWKRTGLHRPRIGIYAIGSNGLYHHVMALLDSGSDFIAFDQRVAAQLGLNPPFSRNTITQGAGTDPFGLTFPEDG